VGLLLASMIDIVSAESPSLQYLPSRTSQRSFTSPRFVSHASKLYQKCFQDYLSCLLSSHEMLSTVLITLSSSTRLSILLTVLGLLSGDEESSPNSDTTQELFRYSLLGLELRSQDLTNSSQQLQLGLSSELLLLKVRFRSLIRLENLLTKYRDSPSSFSSIVSPHLASIIPALLQVLFSLSLSLFRHSLTLSDRPVGGHRVGRLCIDSFKVFAASLSSLSESLF
jgi:hypothetical protein